MTVTRSNVRQNPAYRPASILWRVNNAVYRIYSTDKPYAGLLAALAAYRTNLAVFALHLAALAA